MSVTEEIRQIRDKTTELVDSEILSVLINRIKEHELFCDKMDSLTREYRKKLVDNSPSNKVKALAKSIKLKSQLYESIKGQHEKYDSGTFDTLFIEYNTSLRAYIKTLDNELIRVQDENRFKRLENDVFKIVVLKSFKRFGFKLSQSPIKVGNFFRRIFKKPRLPEKEWTHTIPLKGLTTYHIKYVLATRLTAMLKNYYQVITLTSKQLWKYDLISDQLFSNSIRNSEEEIKEENTEEIPFENIKKQLENLVTVLKKDASEAISKTFDDFEKAFTLVDTIELPASKFDEDRLVKSQTTIDKLYSKITEGWGNTIFTLYDDWELNVELNNVSNVALKEYYVLERVSDEKLESKIIPQLDIISEYLGNINNELNSFSGNDASFKSFLLDKKQKVSQELGKEVLPKTIDLILDQDLQSILDTIENTVKSSMENISVKRTLVPKAEYNKETRTSEISYVSPREIITSEILIKFLEDTKSVKIGIISELEKTQSDIMGIDQVAEFNLDSALAALDDEDKTREEAENIAREGITRANQKIDVIKKSLLNIRDSINDTLEKSVNKCIEGIADLYNSDNIYEINLRLAKAKAVKKTEAIRNKVIGFVLGFVPGIIVLVKRLYTEINSRYDSIRNQLGIGKASSDIGSDLSDYLRETEQSIDKLPYVYQRLFKIEPLVDDLFYEEREIEISTLKKAYGNWLKDRFSPTVIVAESGSGATTLINFFLKKTLTPEKTIRTSITHTIPNIDELIVFFKKVLDKSDFNTIEDISNYLKSLKRRHIIIIEDAEHLYLKRVNGFDSLKTLFELMFNTSRNIFWVISFSKYSWDYLVKTISIQDYFAYVIKMEEQNDHQITDMVLKRHRVSGYNINFVPDELEVSQKKFAKMDEKSQQEYLKKIYFSKLNKFANSNISLALIFWLRSTKEVRGNEIRIGMDIDFDFSFLKSLSNNKLFSLYMLLLHDGLSLEDYVEVMNIPETNAHLSMKALHEDGIILEEDEFFTINPLLYRQVINILRAKNILH